MRTSPLMLVLLVAGGFAAAAIPMVRLTSAPAADTRPATVAEGDTVRRVPARAVVKWAHRPDRLILSLAGHEWLAVDKPAGADVSTTAELPLVPEGVEFTLEATWPEGTPATALTVELEPEEHEAQAVTRWTDAAALSEILLFRWK